MVASGVRARAARASLPLNNFFLLSKNQINKAVGISQRLLQRLTAASLAISVSIYTSTEANKRRGGAIRSGPRTFAVLFSFFVPLTENILARSVTDYSWV